MQHSILKKFFIFTQFALLTISLAQHSAAQKQHITLENSKTGVYRALAQLTFRSFREGDAETAATLGRILDRTWDQIEESGERGLKKSDPKLFERIDEAMDAFIKPVIHYDRKAPEPAEVETTYNKYLEELKSAALKAEVYGQFGGWSGPSGM